MAKHLFFFMVVLGAKMVYISNPSISQHRNPISFWKRPSNAWHDREHQVGPLRTVRSFRSWPLLGPKRGKLGNPNQKKGVTLLSEIWPNSWGFYSFFKTKIKFRLWFHGPLGEYVSLIKGWRPEKKTGNMFYFIFEGHFVLLHLDSQDSCEPLQGFSGLLFPLVESTFAWKFTGICKHAPSWYLQLWSRLHRGGISRDLLQLNFQLSNERIPVVWVL